MQGKVCFSKFNKLLDGTINLTQTSEKTRGQKLRKLFLSKPTESMVTNGSASHCVWKAGKFAIFLISYRTDNQVKNHFYSQLRRLIYKLEHENNEFNITFESRSKRFLRDAITSQKNYLYLFRFLMKSFANGEEAADQDESFESSISNQEAIQESESFDANEKGRGRHPKKYLLKLLNQAGITQEYLRSVINSMQTQVN